MYQQMALRRISTNNEFILMFNLLAGEQGRLHLPNPQTINYRQVTGFERWKGAGEIRNFPPAPLFPCSPSSCFVVYAQ
jgi:hypothetical protein